jgi:hypothetical protein
VGLTVVMKFASVIAPFKKLILPQNSIRSIESRLHGRSRRGSQSGAKSP